MTGLRMTNGSIFGRRGRKSRGFTLVELIVILIIVAILAAAGVATALGYIKKTKFDKNNQSAITVYQTAQTALSNKMANGTIQRWILDLPGFDASDVDFTSDSETNFSQHKTVSLTYNHKTPGGVQDKYLLKARACRTASCRGSWSRSSLPTRRAWPGGGAVPAGSVPVVLLCLGNILFCG